ncbi:RNA polymerase sigma factor [Parapedobacter tibetensis]|uniref:RNA polymerase sigma factor n=1 Tax=Parapedobacter tibetensis TaxID=2972951 RepID=UPI00214DA7F7|nr:sigma-70 family RNA polymerase sigma factor [Parapedobacter tibetensis]
MKQAIQYLRQVQLGQESGLMYFMSKFGKSLRFFAYSIVQNKEVAEEIVSDSFYKLWKGRDRVKSVDSMKAFLYITTRNACYDYVGSPKNNLKTEEEEALADLVEPDADILTQMIHVELVDIVVQEVNNLPEQQATIFRMSYLEGLSTQEICERLGTTTNTVYFARSKALTTLKKVFEQKDLKLP